MASSAKNGPRCDTCGSRHLPTEPHAKDLCSKCGNLHEYRYVLKETVTAGECMDGVGDWSYEVVLDEFNCPVAREERRKSILEINKNKMWQNVLSSILSADAKLGCFFNTRYQELHVRYNRTFSTDVAELVERIMRKALTKGDDSRLYRSTPQSVKTAIQKYEEARQKYEEFQKL